MPSSAQPPCLARLLARAPPPGPPHPPRRGSLAARLRRGRLARRSRPALRGALRLVGFAPEGIPAAAPPARESALVENAADRTDQPALSVRGQAATARARVRARKARSRVTLACVDLPTVVHGPH